MARTTATKKRQSKNEPLSEQQEQTPLSTSENEQVMTRTIDSPMRRRPVSDGWQPSGLKSINERQLARGLGLFSIGLGLAEVLAPKGLAKFIGIKKNNPALIRAFGVREIASGIAILSQKTPVESVWSRVFGDALDLAVLGRAYALPKTDTGRLTFATVSVLGVTALDVICAQQLSRNYGNTAAKGAIRVQKSITINRSPEEVYSYWKDFRNLPNFMYHLESVEVTGEGRSHWVASAPAGTTVEWDAEILEDRPNERIVWRSLPGADVDNAGIVEFERATGGRGTVVRVEMEYSPPGGVIGAGIAWMFGEEPKQQMSDDLRRFKQVIETGEIVRSEAALQGAGVIMQRPAQPSADLSELQE